MALDAGSAKARFGAQRVFASISNPQTAFGLFLRAAALSACILLLACLMASFLPSSALAYDTSKGTNKADPSTGTTQITIRQTVGDEGWKLIPSWSESPGTRYRWNGSQYTFCINPSCGMGKHTGANETFPARVLAASDFKSADQYRAMLALLYYSPSGPGYESLGKTIWNIRDYQGNAMSEQTIFGMAHVLMGYYYNGCDWTATWYDRYSDYLNGSGDIGARIPNEFRNWCYNQLIPSSASDTTGKQVGAQCNKYATDDLMLEHGGYTMDEWSKHVYLVMTGGVEHDNYQDFITWDGEAPAEGTVTLAKKNASPSLTDSNPCYSLAGAVYGIFSDEACTKRIASLSTDAKGSASATVPAGIYYVKETSASGGFSLDPKTYRVSVGSGSTATVESPEQPLSTSINVAAAKVDADTGKAQPQGNASLEGAVFTVCYYNGLYTASSLPSKPTRTWTFTTGADGQAPFTKKALASGTLFEDSSGKPIIPLGTLTFQETKAPAGYKLGTAGNSEAKLYVAQVKEADGKAAVVPLNYKDATTASNTPLVDEQVKHIGVRVAKTDAQLKTSQPQGDATLAGTVFEVVNTSAKPVVVNGKTYAKGEVCATMKSTASDSGCAAELSGATLPFGSYLVREQQAPEGYLPNSEWKLEFAASASTNDGQVFDLTGSPCEDAPIRGGIELFKIDRETMANEPLGAAHLDGALIDITLASGQPVYIDGKVYETGDVVCTLETDGDGYAKTANDLLPYATYRLSERQAPVGYLCNSGWEAIVQVRAQDETVRSADVDDQVKRGDVRFNKVDSASMKRLAGVAFLVISNTTGEQHVIVADENGSVDTSASWAAHTYRTNANDQALVQPGDNNVEADAHDAQADDSSLEAGQDAMTAAAAADDTAAESTSGVQLDTASDTDGIDVCEEQPEPVPQKVEGHDSDTAIEAASSDEPDSTDDSEDQDDLQFEVQAAAEPHEETPTDEQAAEEEQQAEGSESTATVETPASDYEIDESLLDAEAGCWFTGGNDAAEPDDGLGALPYDTYTFRELRSPANEGYELVSFEVRVSRNGYDLDMGSIDDGAIYEPPEEPEEPTEPEPPEEPSEPTEPEPEPEQPTVSDEPEPEPAKDEPTPTPSKETSEKKKAAGKAAMAKTGDINPAIPLTIALLGAAAATLALLARRRSRMPVSPNLLTMSPYATAGKENRRMKEMLQGLTQRGPRRALAAAALAIAALLVSIALTQQAFAETGQVTIQSKDNVDAQYLVYQVFTADVEDGTGETDDRMASHLKWASDAMRDTVLSFLAEADTGAATSYDEWLATNGHANGESGTVSDTDRQNPQNAAEYLSATIDTSAIDVDAATTPPTREALTFASNLAEALRYSDLEPIQATSGTPFSGAEGLYLFVTDPDSIEAGEATTAPMWIPIGSSMRSITEKTAATTLTKTVFDTDGDSFGKFADVHTGQDVSFQISTTMPQNIKAHRVYHWKISDTLPSGLELKGSDTSSVTVALGETDITSKLRGEAGSVTYEDGVLIVDITNLLALEGVDAPDASSEVTVSYQAHLMPGSSAGALANNVSFTHTAGPLAEGDVTDTIGGSAYIASYSVLLDMRDKSTAEALPGAGFTVQVESGSNAGQYVQADGSLGGTPYEFVSASDGTVTIPNIDAGTYRLAQTTAPEGYESQDADIILVVAAEHNAATGELETLVGSASGGEQAQDPDIGTHVSTTDSNAGSVTLITSNDKNSIQLPITGLSGNALTYLLGGIVVVLSVLVLVLQLRNRRDRNQANYEPPVQPTPSNGTRWQYW